MKTTLKGLELAYTVVEQADGTKAKEYFGKVRLFLNNKIKGVVQTHTQDAVVDWVIGETDRPLMKRLALIAQLRSLLGNSDLANVADYFFGKLSIMGETESIKMLSSVVAGATVEIEPYEPTSEEAANEGEDEDSKVVVFYEIKSLTLTNIGRMMLVIPFARECMGLNDMSDIKLVFGL